MAANGWTNIFGAALKIIVVTFHVERGISLRNCTRLVVWPPYDLEQKPAHETL